MYCDIIYAYRLPCITAYLVFFNTMPFFVDFYFGCFYVCKIERLSILSRVGSFFTRFMFFFLNLFAFIMLVLLCKPFRVFLFSYFYRLCVVFAQTCVLCAFLAPFCFSSFYTKNDRSQLFLSIFSIVLGILFEKTCVFTMCCSASAFRM